MKANKAPERIWMDSEWIPHFDCKDCITDDSVEYVRTDAFIEKACAWLKESITNNPKCNRIISKKGVITMGLLIEDFVNYMKEE